MSFRYQARQVQAPGKLALFLVSDGMLAIAFIAVLLFGPSTRGKTLEQIAGLAEKA